MPSPNGHLYTSNWPPTDGVKACSVSLSYLDLLWADAAGTEEAICIFVLFGVDPL